MLSSTFIDELGYLALDQETSNLFYQVISTRHARQRSTLITTNTVFSEWGTILHNTTIAAAIVDSAGGKLRDFSLGWGEPAQSSGESAASARLIGGSSQAPLCAIAHHRRSPAGKPLNGAADGTGVNRPRANRGQAPLSRPCSTSAPIISACSRGRSTGRAQCCCCWTATLSAFIGCTTSRKPSTSCRTRPTVWQAKSTAPISPTW